MATIVPLILKREHIDRFGLGAQRVRNPNVALVYATAQGTLEIIDDGKPTGLLDHVAGRYKFRYEVDLTDHSHTVQLRTMPPAARGGLYHFDAWATIGFRVIDPVEVVRRRVQDGLQAVCDHLMFSFNEITANFAIEDAKAAQDEINARFHNRQIIHGCIELYQCLARLEADAAAKAYLVAEEAADRKNRVHRAQHELNADDARRTDEIRTIEQESSLKARERERAALGGRPLSLQDMIALHLERHPGDTAGAMEMIARIREAETAERMRAEDQRQHLIGKLLDTPRVLPEELSGVVSTILSGTSGQPTPAIERVGRWDDPLPAQPTEAREQLPGIIPVYLVVDVSHAAADTIDALNGGLQSLYGSITYDPDVVSVVRLSLISYGARESIEISLQQPQRGFRVPSLAADVGPSRLSGVFEHLTNCIPRDAEALKALTPALRRPQVLLLSMNRLHDTAQWHQARSALIDRDRNRYAPEILACGAGQATPQDILAIATQPDLAFIAAEGDPRSAVDGYCDFAWKRITQYGRAVLNGDQAALVKSPTGYRPAIELIAAQSKETWPHA